VRTHFPESQRDSVTQPKVAESARLPWDGRRIGRQPQRGCVIWRGNIRHNPVGVDDHFDTITQGSSFLATAGLNDIAPLGQNRWAEQRRIVAELDALQAQVDALKRLQTETVAELDALLPAILDRAFKGEL